ncbi:DUF3995 domain-containing protein [Streptomyces sp. NBC_01565]|uniref:DUF3995 domain-containing protein n=1 Tax=unclassified Streptomyces TaxID=2593676 RepID=UPI002252117D|nr:DUF3995 domain-containing protein [Streptomyces sp. NBC_01565]MCX4546315.1 DUF3995 domain-containing protein [Streptomyces sp. NBC_01565]
MSRPERRRGAAYGAALCCAAYGAMKLAQALGGTVLADKDPLPPELRERLLARDPLFVASHWLLATAAVLGVVAALATVRPWGARAPRRLLLGFSGVLGAAMILRSVGVAGFGFVGDVLVLTSTPTGSAEHAELARELARWDLLLWSPFFLLWGVCWLLTAWPLRGVHGSRPASRTPRNLPTDFSSLG